MMNFNGRDGNHKDDHLCALEMTLDEVTVRLKCDEI
ncbi:MAG: hypothetical protein K0S36_2584 [Nitrosospira multiformis]|jgi:hypothetical protein|nr:hypothetical protein [Nitrosospira multiformis]